MQAAEQARAQHALEIAEQQYRIALRGANTDEVRFRVVEGLGDTLMLRGRYDSAGELFESAAAVAKATYAEAEIRCKLGELAFKRGVMDVAIDHFIDCAAIAATLRPEVELVGRRPLRLGRHRANAAHRLAIALCASTAASAE